MTFIRCGNCAAIDQSPAQRGGLKKGFMFFRKLCTGSAALTCLAVLHTANAAPAFQVLYHERLEIASRVDTQGQQHLGFGAYGQHFDLDLQSNERIRQGVPANRSDIKPYQGTVTGHAGSWVRLTQTRDGWRGVLFDGQDLYAIETAGQLEKAGVQSVTEDSSSPVMYRFADTLMPDTAAYCGTDSDTDTSSTQSSRSTALSAYTEISKDLSMKDTSTTTTRQLVVSVVTDHQFTDTISSDPAGEITARMNVVDGIWSAQVGIHIALGTVKILTDTTDTFSSTTSSSALLAEVAQYRGKTSASDGSGLTHLMSGRTLDSNIIGIAYVGEVCDGSNSVSLSDTTVSTTMGALVAAHELGHNFNAPHDGAAGGACASTPQTYLMAPQINFSNQFSSCSLTQINARLASASCVQTVSAASSGGTSDSSGTSSSGTSGTGGTVSDSGSSTTGSSSGGGGGSLDFAWIAFLTACLILQARTAIRRQLPIARQRRR
jgi:hypothetical protein